MDGNWCGVKPQYGITGLAPSYPDKLVKMLPRLKQLKEFRDCKTLTNFGKVAYEERLNGGGSTWGDISKRAMRKRFTYSTYVQQYFTGIREDVDGIVDKVLETCRIYYQTRKK